MFNFIFFVYFLPSFKNIYDVGKPESHKEIVNKEILETFDDILWATRQLRNSILEKKKINFPIENFQTDFDRTSAVFEWKMKS